MCLFRETAVEYLAENRRLNQRRYITCAHLNVKEVCKNKPFSLAGVYIDRGSRARQETRQRYRENGMGTFVTETITSNDNKGGDNDEKYDHRLSDARASGIRAIGSWFPV
jgi:hypothetical protein